MRGLWEMFGTLALIGVSPAVAAPFMVVTVVILRLHLLARQAS